MTRRARRSALLAATASLLVGGVAFGVVTAQNGRIGPSLRLLGNGRRLTPSGKLFRLGNFPLGGALTPDGRFYWTVSGGEGLNDIRIVSVRSGRVVQVLRLPGASGGIVMDPTQRRAYVSGVADSSRKDERLPGAPGRQGDVVHVFRYTQLGRASFVKVIPVPPPPLTLPSQSFPPLNLPALNLKPVAWPDRLAIAPDGGTLLVPLNLADQAAIVDLATNRVRYVPTGRFPYGAAVLRGGRIGVVSNEVPGTVSVIDLRAARKLKDIRVGARLSHPEAIAVDPQADRAYVAIANSDQVAVIDTKRLTVERTLSVERSEGFGTAPNDVAVTADGSRLLVTEGGADEIAVFGLPSFRMIGRIPVGSYPTDVDVASPAANPCTTQPRRRHRRRPVVRRCAKLVWVSGKGLGYGPNPRGPNSYVINDDNTLSQHFLPTTLRGAGGVLDFPTDARIRALTTLADRQVRPSNPQKAPADTPLRPGGPIKHVFYIVKENRTYDQVLGDVARGDGDPALTLFGKRITPNAHALVERFPLLDHVYADSEASIDGHYWTSAADVPDYVQKTWQQSFVYGDRGRPYDANIYVVGFPPHGFLLNQAERQGISYYNFGEAIAGNVPIFPDIDRTADDLVMETKGFAKSDGGQPFGPTACYPNDAFNAKNPFTMNPIWDSTPPPGAPPNSESRFDCFKRKFTVQLLTNSVPSLTYMILHADHTRGSDPAYRTPRAMVAENDYALGQVVDLISHSKVWKDSAIFVVEDDAQDGPDHVDAHRIPAYVMSPYAKRGAVVHTRYDQLSVIRSLELILGMKPLYLFDALATPMYDAFKSTPDPAPFDVLAPTYSLVERNPPKGPNAALSRSLDFDHTDAVPEYLLDRILWQSVHGPHSQPPPPGPNAQRGE